MSRVPTMTRPRVGSVDEGNQGHKCLSALHGWLLPEVEYDKTRPSLYGLSYDYQALSHLLHTLPTPTSTQTTMTRAHLHERLGLTRTISIINVACSLAFGSLSHLISIISAASSYIYTFVLFCDEFHL